MPLAAWVAIAVWTVGAVVVWRRLFLEFARFENPRWGWEVEWDDVAFAILISTCIAVMFWPFVAGFYALQWAVRRAQLEPADVVRTLGKESRADRLARREQEVRRREEHIRKLEREAGVGDESL